METNSDHTDRAAADEALASLAADRNHLVSRIRVPWTLMAAFGALGAWWVGAAAATEPGASYQPPLSSWLALLGVFVVVHLVQRESGVRLRAMGARAGWVVVGIVVVCLTLFSISLGLVSLDLRWAVAITSVVAFVVTTWLAGLAYRLAVEQLSRG